MRARRANGARLGLALVAAATLLHPGGAEGQTAPAPALGGYEGKAAATGVHVFYNPAGLLPIGPPVDLGAPDALATIASGPSTFARAAAADPGDLLANPDALLQQAGAEPGTLPAYPFRITARNGVGAPSDQLSPAPGIDTKVSADDTGSRATATMPALSAPAVLTAGTLSSAATTTFDGSTVTVHARSELSGLDLAGLVKIESVVTDLTATTDGASTALTGGTVVTGAELLGQPVTIDAEGIHASAAEGGGSSPLAAALDDAVEALGIDITVAAPIEQASDTAGQLASAGLRIDFELSDRTFPVLDDVLGLVDLLPPIPPLAPGAPGVDDVLAVARARHLVSLQVGGGSVEVSARPAAPRREATAPTGAVPPVAPSRPAAPSATLALPTPTAPVPAPPSEVGAAPISAAPSADLATGIGVLAVLALLAQPLVGGQLSKAAALMTAAGPSSACPREGR